MASLRAKGAEGVDPASLVAFRVAFGLLATLGAARFVAKGWIEDLYLTPTLFFPYPGLSFIQPLPAPGMYALFALMAVLGLMIATGRAYRPAIILYGLAFTYVELIDRSNYLNHYYFISCCAFLMASLPLGRLSLKGESPQGARWMIWALRLQVGMVYVFAGLAKVQSDWLIDAQPLTIWLTARGDRPIIGPLLSWPLTPYLMSWGGCVFDLIVPFALAIPRSRALAYLGVIAFHGLTGWLFNIGVFPWVMIALTPIFFGASWPRRFLGQRRGAGAIPPSGSSRALALTPLKASFLGLALMAQLLIPLRHHLYPGNHLWHESGFRFAWHVMVMEKTGHLDYIVTCDCGHRQYVYPGDLLTPTQHVMVRTQPDMILHLAKEVKAQREAEGHSGVEVRARSRVSLNGRPSQVFIDPEVDLGEIEDGLGPRSWVLPLNGENH